MASKRNQEALEHLKTCLDDNGSYYKNFTSSFQPFMEDIDTLQQAIDNEELYKKAFYKVVGTLNCYENYSDVHPETLANAFLIESRKEVENETK